MIIWGIKETQITSEHITGVCPNCLANNSLTIHLFQRYASVFWIPFVPTNKNGASQCDKCGQVVNYKKMQPSLRLAYDNLKARTKPAVWMFSGAFLFLFMGIAINAVNVWKSKNASKTILNPQVNDILEVRVNGAYTVFKIKGVKGDSVYFWVNQYQTNDENQVNTLADKGELSYDTVRQVITKSGLIDMSKTGDLIGIVRK